MDWKKGFRIHWAGENIASRLSVFPLLLFLSRFFSLLSPTAIWTSRIPTWRPKRWPFWDQEQSLRISCPRGWKSEERETNETLPLSFLLCVIIIFLIIEARFRQVSFIYNWTHITNPPTTTTYFTSYWGIQQDFKMEELFQKQPQ